MTEAVCERVARDCVQLQYLDVSYSSGVSAGALEKIAATATKLRILLFERCLGVKGPLRLASKVRIFFTSHQSF